MTSSHNPDIGICLMLAAVATFAAQDAFARHFAGTSSTQMVNMILYWVIAGFVLVLALWQPEGQRSAIRSARLPWHMVRSCLLVAEICLIVRGHTQTGLLNSLAVFSVFPLLIVALSGPILGEAIGWQRWAAVGAGLCALSQERKPA